MKWPSMITGTTIQGSHLIKAAQLLIYLGRKRTRISTSPMRRGQFIRLTQSIHKELKVIPTLTPILEVFFVLTFKDRVIEQENTLIEET